MGSQSFKVPLRSLFPTAIGVFGPFHLRIAKIAKPLQMEYGQQCLRERSAVGQPLAALVERSFSRRALVAWGCAALEIWSAANEIIL